MSFNADKKREHEQAAEKALLDKDYVKAFFHTAKAADFCFNLAEQSDEKLARAHLDDANELLDIAAELKTKAEKQKKNKKEKITSSEENADTAEEDNKKVETSVPKVTFDDVKGLAEAKQIVQDALINPTLHPDIYEAFKVKPGTGLLLYGPPGTGKSMFAKAVATELDATFMLVKLNELKSKYVGDSEKNVAEMFEQAREHKRCVLFLDECESILRKRGSQKIATVEQFLQEADGLTDNKNQLFILLATNRPWLIDSAVMRSGRIGAQVYIGLPDSETRKAIITTGFDGVKLADDVNIEELIKITDGYSGAEIYHHKGGGVCNKASQLAARRHVQLRADGEAQGEQMLEVTWDDCTQAIKAVRPVSQMDPEILKKNSEWGRSNDSQAPSDEDDD